MAIEYAFKTAYTPQRRYKRAQRMLSVQHSPEDWKKLADEAKRKELFWTKGFLPSSIEAIYVADSKAEDSEDNFKLN